MNKIAKEKETKALDTLEQKCHNIVTAKEPDANEVLRMLQNIELYLACIRTNRIYYWTFDRRISRKLNNMRTALIYCTNYKN